jgi:hypothetical protein
MDSMLSFQKDTLFRPYIIILIKHLIAIERFRIGLIIFYGLKIY